MVTVCVDQKADFIRSETKWGPQPIDLAALLAALTPEERAQISVDSAGHLCGPHWQVCADSTATADVVAAVQAAAARAAQARAEEQAREAAARAQAVAHAQAYLAGAERQPYGECRGYLDDDLRAQVDAEIQRREAEQAAQLERERAETIALTAQREAALLAWAAEHGSDDLKAAVQHGYPLGTRGWEEAEEWIAAQIARNVGAASLVIRGYSVGHVRPVPSQRAYEACVQIVRSLHDLAARLGLAESATSIGRISRLGVDDFEPCEACQGEGCDGCDGGERYIERPCTGVEVTIAAPWGQHTLAFVIHED